ncbi:MAG: hypothetical protein ACKO2P_05105 [Planctomycetota bacterium]
MFIDSLMIFTTSGAVRKPVTFDRLQYIAMMRTTPVMRQWSLSCPLGLALPRDFASCSDQFGLKFLDILLRLFQFFLQLPVFDTEIRGFHPPCVS